MNHLKAISTTSDELRVGNYIVLFGGKDLVGEFFTPNTNFKSNYTDLGVMYVDFEHGFDVDKMGNDKDNVLGLVDWKSARVDEKGIFVERILNRRAGYMKFVEELIGAGIIGTSSQAIPGSSARKSNGEIIEWPLMRDTLTVTPMEPRMAGANVLAAAKSLYEVFPHTKSLAKICGIEIEERDDEMKSLADCERALRELGMTKSKSTAFVSLMKKLARSDSDPEDIRSESGMAAIAAALKARAVHLPTHK